MSRTRSAVNPHSIVAWMSRNSLIEAGAIFEDLVTVTGLDWPILLYGWVIVHKLSGCGFESVAVAKIVTFGGILRALFSCNRHFLRFALLPYYQRIKAVVSKIILGAVSRYFEKNLLQTNPTFLLFFFNFLFTCLLS